MVRLPPSLSNSCSCSTRRSLGCNSSGKLSNFVQKQEFRDLPVQVVPAFWATAPVKAPFSCPNNSLSRRPTGIAAQFNLMNGAFFRGLMLMNRTSNQLLAGTGRLPRSEPWRRCGQPSWIGPALASTPGSLRQFPQNQAGSGFRPAAWQVAFPSLPDVSPPSRRATAWSIALASCSPTCFRRSKSSDWKACALHARQIEASNKTFGSGEWYAAHRLNSLLHQLLNGIGMNSTADLNR